MTLLPEIGTISGFPEGGIIDDCLRQCDFENKIAGRVDDPPLRWYYLINTNLKFFEDKKITRYRLGSG